MSNALIRNRMALEGIKVSDSIFNGTIEVLTSHESIRGFQKIPLSDEMVEAIITSARSAPTSSNLQAYSVIVVRENDRKNKLMHYSGDQKFIGEAPVFLVFCADIYRLKYVTKRQGYNFESGSLEMFLLAAVDATLVMQNALVAAESLGLAAVPVGSIRNNPVKVADELRLPSGVFALVGLAIGYEKQGVRRGVKPRLPKQCTVHNEVYSTEELEEGLVEYDQQMISRRTYYGRRVSIAGEPEREGVEYGWCEHTARRCTSPETIAASASLRKNLRAILISRGFSFK
ncbi:NADPH-dependent oxidoreductase [Alkalihalobacillus sp. TS-13]|uniref:NADPH-dependent oxidoreductase n=1 Tax=Alkalihalobacillus sp. TS-13 TaxID=2842455 RepID=UPI001C870650|nr:NADPH-dependent oxidoreductase [Alkalihalobacillus sp. TS-13]